MADLHNINLSDLCINIFRGLINNGSKVYLAGMVEGMYLSYPDSGDNLDDLFHELNTMLRIHKVLAH